MIRTLFYGMILKSGVPALVPVDSVADLNDIPLSANFAVSANVPVQYPYSLGVELSAGSTGSGTLMFSITSFSNPATWVDVQPVAIAAGTFADGTRSLFVYNLPTGAAQCRISWTSSAASTGTARVLLRITPQG